MALPFAAIGGNASAITVTQDTVAANLAAAILAGTPGLTVTGSSLSGQSDGFGAVSSGTYTNATGIYGIGSGVVLSSGNVSDYDDGLNTQTGFTTGYGVAATAAQEGLLTGGSFDHNDVTQLDPTSGVGDPIMLFQGTVGAGSTGNTLTFIIADSGDIVLDSTVYIEGFGTSDPGGGTPGGVETEIPEPASMLLFGLGLAGLGYARRERAA